MSRYYDCEDFHYQKPEYISKIAKLGQLRHNINLAQSLRYFVAKKVLRLPNGDMDKNLENITDDIGYMLGNMYKSPVHGSYDITEISKGFVELANILKKEIKVKEETITKMKKKKVKENGKKIRKMVEVKEIKKKYYTDITAEEFFERKDIKKILDKINKAWFEIEEQDAEYKKKKEERQKRYEEKMEKLKELRKTALGIGTRKIKLRLNKLAKQGDNIAKLLRLLLELEDINIKAKQTIPYYRDKVYNMKDWHIKEVITFLKEINYDKDYGFKKDTELDNEAMVFYFDLPGTDEQVSWHTYNNNNIIPEDYLKIEYKKDWIGETEETTYERILESIEKLYNNIMK